ncbi:DUF4395 domain-containing protein [Nocardia sp. 004]|uniref:DUF4395 domain-containing protein n=1 Tax=Nocardia sp. 004 TaxID=3385978 RepID=UPI0039A0B0E9
MSIESHNASRRTPVPADHVDVRGPRFAAWVTAAVLAMVLIATALSPLIAAVLIALQAVVFAVGAGYGPRRHPYGRIYAEFVAPHRAPTEETEPVAPLRFAQLIGFAFAAASLLGFALGSPVTGAALAGTALFVAFLNAAFGICLGCQVYPLVAQLHRNMTPASN